jgi:hypothetical protein
MIVELNAFGLTKLFDIDGDREFIEMLWQQKVSPRIIEHPAYNEYMHETPKRVMFRWFGEYNHDNIRIYYLDSIK